MAIVDLGKQVDREHLKIILIETAREKGFRVKIKDNYNKGYQLGSVKETKKLRYTDIILTGRLFRAMTLSILGQALFSEASVNAFGVYTGSGSGCAGKKTIREYLEAVSAKI